MNTNTDSLKLVSSFVLVCSIALSIFAFARNAEGQSNEGGSDFSLFGGYMLPNQIDNVTEILPLFGGRYGMALPMGAAEFSFENAHSKGVDWTSLGVSLRGDIPIGQGMTGFVYAGPDFHYYIPAFDTNRHSETGLHFGVGTAVLVKDSLWVRGDLKFMGNPGTALYLLFGIMFRPPGAQ